MEWNWEIQKRVSIPDRPTENNIFEGQIRVFVVDESPSVWQYFLLKVRRAGRYKIARVHNPEECLNRLPFNDVVLLEYCYTDPVWQVIREIRNWNAEDKPVTFLYSPESVASAVTELDTRKIVLIRLTKNPGSTLSEPEWAV